MAAGLTMSLDGFIAGPNDGPENPLGEGGMRLFEWYSSGDTDYELPGTGMVFAFPMNWLRPRKISMPARVTMNAGTPT